MGVSSFLHVLLESRITRRTRIMPTLCLNRGLRGGHRKRGLLSLGLPNAYSKFAAIS